MGCTFDTMAEPKQRASVPGATFGALAAVVVGLAIWIWWWPHSDNRQNLAIVALAIASVGLGSSLYVIRKRLRGQQFIRVLLGAVVFGCVLFFALAVWTADACGTCRWFDPVVSSQDGTRASNMGNLRDRGRWRIGVGTCVSVDQQSGCVYVDDEEMGRTNLILPAERSFYTEDRTGVVVDGVTFRSGDRVLAGGGGGSPQGAYDVCDWTRIFFVSQLNPG